MRDELRTSLAPEDQAGLGQGGLELAEWLAMVSPGGDTSLPAATPMPASPANSPAELSSLVEQWVRRVALGGDQRRGVARIDIGQGRFAGAELLVMAEAGQVSVELSLPTHANVPGIGERLRARLEQRGLSADVVVR